VRIYNTIYGLPSIVVRPTNNFGPYQHPEKFIPLMITRALREEFLPVYGDGKQRRDWLYVDDCVRAIALIMEKGKTGEVYNISSGEERENIEVVYKILEYLGKSRELIRFVRDRPRHDRRYALNSGKLKEEMCWSPLVSFEDGLKETIEWYRANMDWSYKMERRGKSLGFSREFYGF